MRRNILFMMLIILAGCTTKKIIEQPAPGKEEPMKKEIAPLVEEKTTSSEEKGIDTSNRITELNKRLESLEKEKEKLTQQLARRKEEIKKSEELEKERRAIEEEKKVYQQELKSGKEAVELRDFINKCMKEISSIASKKVEESSEGRMLMAQLDEINKKYRDILFKEALLKIHLYNPGSPVQQEVEFDENVKKIRYTIETLQREIKENPLPEVKLLEDKLSELNSRMEEIKEKIEYNEELIRLKKEEETIVDKIRQIENRDEKRKELEKAKRILMEAEKETLKNIKEAEFYIKMLNEEIVPSLNAIKFQRKAIDTVRQSLKTQMMASDNANIKKLKMELDEATKSYNEVMSKNREIKELMEKQVQAIAEFENKHKEWFEGREDYKQLTEQEKELTAKKEDILKKIVDIKEEGKLSEMLMELSELDSKLASLASQKREIRIRVGGKQWDEIYHARSKIQREIEDRVKKEKGILSAQQAVYSAKHKLDNLLSACVSDTDAGKLLDKISNNLTSREMEIKYKEALAKHHLYDKNSIVQDKVSSDPLVIKARSRIEEINNDIKNNPDVELDKLKKELELTRSKISDLKKKLYDESEYSVLKAEIDRIQKEKERLINNDGRAIKIKKLESDLQSTRDLALRNSKIAAEILSQMDELEREKKEMDNRKASILSQINKMTKEIEKSDDKDIAILRSKIEEAEKKLKQLEDSPHLKMIAEKIKEKETIYNKRMEDLLKQDSKCIELQSKINEISSEIRKIESEIKAIKSNRNIESNR